MIKILLIVLGSALPVFSCVHSLAFWEENQLPSNHISHLCDITPSVLLDQESGNGEFYLYAKEYVAADANLKSALTNPDTLSEESFIGGEETLACFLEKETIFESHCGQFPLSAGPERDAIYSCAILLADFNQGRHNLESCPNDIGPHRGESGNDLLIIAENEGVRFVTEGEIDKLHHPVSSTWRLIGIVVVIILTVILWVVFTNLWNPIVLVR